MVPIGVSARSASRRALINNYLGALAKGRTDNLRPQKRTRRPARTLIRRHQDMILRFTTDLAVPWTNKPDRGHRNW